MKWTDSDEGLLRAIQLREALKAGDGLDTIPANLQLAPGERLHMTYPVGMTGVVGYRQGSSEYTRLRVRWARDPLMAPAWFIIVTPINILLWLIAYVRSAPRPIYEDSDGTMYLTSQRLLLWIDGSWINYPWAGIHSLELDWEGVELNGDLLYIDLLASPWTYVALMFLARGVRDAPLTIPRRFGDHARRHGKAVPAI